MLNTGILRVTGRGTNVNFTIDDSAPFDAVIAGVEECLVQNRHLFSKGNITVNVGRRILAREQLTEIKRILETESGLTLAQFWCSPEILEGALSGGRPKHPPEQLAPEALDPDTPINSPDLERVNPEITSPPIGLEELPEHQPESEPPSVPSRLPGSKELEDPPEETQPWPTADPQALAEPEAEILPEAATREDSQALAEPGAENAGDLIPEPSPKPTKEPSIQPIVEPGLLELALVGLEQSVAEGRLESGLDGTTPTLESRLAAHSSEAYSEETNLKTDGPTNTGAGTPISHGQETGGLNRQNEALLIKTTCRSGEVVRYPGDVVILADVNPGAQIIADGDILVFGTLRGLAHAGAGGDIQATIIALNLESPRIQIGPYIGMPPKAKKRSKSSRTGPTLAFVRRQHIFVVPFKGRFTGYSGGTIYDG